MDQTKISCTKRVITTASTVDNFEKGLAYSVLCWYPIYIKPETTLTLSYKGYHIMIVFLSLMILR